MGRPEDDGGVELGVEEVDRDDLRCAGEHGALHDVQPHPARAEHDDRASRLDLRGVQDGADPRHHAARQQRGDVERNVVGDRDDL